ncbi:MAG: flagellar export chaperone FlgN [Phycisphaerales bacterium]
MTERNSAADGLTAALTDIAEANTSLGTLAREQRKAIGMMATEAVAGITAQQRDAGRALADAELARRQHATALAQTLGLPGSASLSDITKALSAHDTNRGDALRDAADAARHAILACQREQRVVHTAAAGVMAHLDGLARQVMAKLNHAGLYAASGSLATGQSPRGVDLVS